MSEQALNKQSTNHIMLIEPALFHANPQTMATNSYQHKDEGDTQKIHSKALAEFHDFRDLLVENGVAITTAKGHKDSPDDIFCNWASTHCMRDGSQRLVLYPMLNQNRQIERRPHLIDLLKQIYKDILDLSEYEAEGIALEATGALCLDRVNRIAYHARSLRSDEELAKLWCEKNDFERLSFDTEYKGKPVYHTDVVMWIGTKLAGVCSECLETRAPIEKLSKTHDIIEFTNAQMEHFCGNSLQVIAYPDSENSEEILVMSEAGYSSLDEAQKDKLGQYYKTILTPKIPTIEYYGGGSARCMMFELF
ncbi:MAG: arginine deiminase-related protein [Pseudomonadota bacterium]